MNRFRNFSYNRIAPLASARGENNFIPRIGTLNTLIKVGQNEYKKGNSREPEKWCRGELLIIFTAVRYRLPRRYAIRMKIVR